MRISELERRSGVSARLLRYYEEQGLLAPGRDARGWRVYDDAAQQRVADIRALLDSALPTAAIRQLLGTGDRVGRSEGVTEDLLDELTQVRAGLDARIRCLTRNREARDAWLREAAQARRHAAAGRQQ